MTGMYLLTAHDCPQQNVNPKKKRLFAVHRRCRARSHIPTLCCLPGIVLAIRRCAAFVKPPKPIRLNTRPPTNQHAPASQRYYPHIDSFQSISQSFNRLINRSHTQNEGKSTSQSINQLINSHFIEKSINHIQSTIINQSSKQSITFTQPINKSIYV